MENELQNNLNYIDKKSAKKSGFSVPLNYFEDIEDSIYTAIREENLERKKGFEIPDSYFDKIEDRILEKVSPLKREPKVISLRERLLKIIPMAAAASIILFIGINSFVFTKTNEDPFDKLADSEVENWISNNINLINDNDIILTYNDIEFDDSEAIPNSISNDELENYLSNQENISLILEND